MNRPAVVGCGARQARRFLATWVLAAWAAVVVLLSGSNAAGQYPVRFSAPHRVGEKWRVRHELTQVQQKTARRGDQVADQKTETSRIEFAAEVEVLQVDHRGKETQVLLTVDKALLLTEDERVLEIAKPGTRILAEVQENKTVFRAREEGRTLPELAVKLLPRVVKLAEGPVTLDDLFGADTPREVGSSWPADQEKMLELLRGLDPTIKPEDASGSAELVGIAMVDGKEYLDVRFAVSTRSTTPPAPPKDMLPLGTTLQIEGTGRFPADHSTEEVAHTLQVRMVGKFQGKPGTDKEGYVFEISSTESERAATEYVAWAAAATAEERPADVPAVDEPFVMPPAAREETADGPNDAGGPEEVLRRFLLAMVANDRAGVKRTSLPHPDAALLWQGELPSQRELQELQAQSRAIEFTRLRAGDSIALPGGNTFVVGRNQVNENRLLLEFPDFGLPLPVIRQQGKWRVDASPVIVAFKAAARAAAADNEGRALSER